MSTDVFFFPFMDGFYTNCSSAFHENLLKIKAMLIAISQSESVSRCSRTQALETHPLTGFVVVRCQVSVDSAARGQ